MLGNFDGRFQVPNLYEVLDKKYVVGMAIS